MPADRPSRSAPPSLLLVGNYPPDGQISMARYAETLRDGMRTRGWRVELLRPTHRLNRIGDPRRGLGKWLGHVDKLLLFPRELHRQVNRLRAKGPLLVHVCDHANAPYLSVLQDLPHLITCHDLIAVRAALGQIPEQPTRLTGRILQHAVLKWLGRAGLCVCVSDQTRRELIELTALPEARVERVYNGLNYPYRPMAPRQARDMLTSLPALRALQADAGGLKPFLLHVGVEVWYKNRRGLLRIYRELLRHTDDAPELLLVGPPLPAEETAWLAEEGLNQRVHRLDPVDSGLLRTLYSAAEAMLFPSLAEGFGWPVLEALACACPVAASGLAPITEVGGDAVAYFDPHDPAAAAAVVEGLLREGEDSRRQRRERALARAESLSADAMLDGYEDLYRRLLTEHAGAQPAKAR